MNRETNRNNALARCRERGIVIPTLEQMRHPGRIPGANYDQDCCTTTGDSK